MIVILEWPAASRTSARPPASAWLKNVWRPWWMVSEASRCCPKTLQAVRKRLRSVWRDRGVGGRPGSNEARRLEPGIRECYAIVIMPSFVPYTTFNFSTNWFKLKNPKCKELDSTDAMRLSRLVKNIEVRTEGGRCRLLSRRRFRAAA